MTLDARHLIAHADLRALEEWTGLTAASVDELEAGGVVIDREFGGSGSLGSDQIPTQWFAADSAAYEEGVRVWFRDGQCVLIEAQLPIDVDGEPTVASDIAAFGEADATFETFLGRLRIPDGEHVFASRGLTITLNPENDMVLSIYGYSATTLDDYENRLRPQLEAKQLLPRPDDCEVAP